MATSLVVLKEVTAEARVAASPDSCTKLVGLGLRVAVEAGAGQQSGFSDADYKAAGARIHKSIGGELARADIVIGVRAPVAARIKKMKKNAILIAQLDPYQNKAGIKNYATQKIQALAMEWMPRITRAQSMDVLSSQSNLAGYKAVLDATAEYNRALPMMMTAAGTIPAARVFVMGAGVAGLQAVATAKRLGAIVSATDVRRTAAEQVESLGGTFVMVDAGDSDSGETAGGYAKEMSADYQKRQAELVAAHIAKQDIVICTALIPGRAAPRLVSRKMVESMQAGAVIVDLAAEQGGNCEMSKLGKIVTHKGVKIIAHANMAGRLAGNASALYARNVLNFISAFWNGEDKVLDLDWNDEIIAGIGLTRDGQIVHPILQEQAAQKPTQKIVRKPKSASTAKKTRTRRTPHTPRTSRKTGARVARK